MSPFEIIFASIGGSAVLFGVVGFLFKSLISHLLDKDVALYKSTLEKISFEHRVIFGKLHETRAEITLKLYSSIVELENKVSTFVNYAVSVDEVTNRKHMEELWKAADDFKGIFQKNRIIYSVDLCRKLDDLNNSLSEAVSELVMNIELNQETSEWKQLAESWKKAKDLIDSKSPALKEAVEKEFRELLWVLN